MNVQVFLVEVQWPGKPFVNEGRCHTFVYDEWFSLAERTSRAYPDCEIVCVTIARIRRRYKNGQVIQDRPDFPYTNNPEGDRW
jgi:hypothetical protein